MPLLHFRRTLFSPCQALTVIIKGFSHCRYMQVSVFVRDSVIAISVIKGDSIWQRQVFIHCLIPLKSQSLLLAAIALSLLCAILCHRSPFALSLWCHCDVTAVSLITEMCASVNAQILLELRTRRLLSEHLMMTSTAANKLKAVLSRCQPYTYCLNCTLNALVLLTMKVVLG